MSKFYQVKPCMLKVVEKLQTAANRSATNVKTSVSSFEPSAPNQNFNERAYNERFR